MTADEKTRKTRGITTSTALKTGAVGVVGIVFFVLSAQAPLTSVVGGAALTMSLGSGPGTPASYLVVGIILTLFAVGFIAMSRRVRAKGAFYAYVGVALGRRWGAGAAWMALLAYWAIQATMYGLYGFSLALLVEPLGLHLPWWVFSFVTLVLIEVLGSLNLELGARLLAVLVTLEVVILVAFAAAVLFRHHAPEGVDLTASFTPAAFAQGAFGISVMFAFASMFGFESTAIYSSEAKDPVKTVPRATYLSIVLIGVFYAVVMWTIVVYYGPSKVASASASALASGDAGAFVFAPLSEMLGPWVATAANLLLISSLFAGMLAFHNAINRYLHSLGLHGSLPRWISGTNRFRAPARAALVQSIVAALIIAPFAILGLDPVATLFAWLSGVAVVALLVLYVVASLAFPIYFRRHRQRESVWQAYIAPVLAAIGLGWVLFLVVGNFTVLIGGDLATAAWLLAVIPIVFAVGIAVERRTAQVDDEDEPAEDLPLPPTADPDSAVRS